MKASAIEDFIRSGEEQIKSTNLGIKVASTLTNSVKESEKQDFLVKQIFFAEVMCQVEKIMSN